MSLLPMNDLTTSGFYLSSLIFAFSALLLGALYFYRWTSNVLSLFIWLFTYGVAGIITYQITQLSMPIFIVLGLNFLLVILLSRLKPIISLFGIFFLISLFSPSMYGLAWLFELLQNFNASLSFASSLFIWSGGIFVAILIILNTIMGTWVILCRFANLYFCFPRLQKGWKIAAESKNYPWVSLHVPCYSEPPAVVIETLNALSKLDYPHFEVIVVDNNTKDPNLWRPIQDHCANLGERFRFFHIDPLKGAKAGALNAALKLTAPHIELIGVIDADFIAKSDFLIKLVGFFDDRHLGFIQTCQDYRDWRSSIYRSACYYEYESSFKLEYPGESEWDVTYPVGTMCLIRRDVLDKVGGWAEWCLTEDSEVGVRIHAMGYSGYYLRNTFGEGLIPETFEAYKQQRFRWAAGPVQQFQRYWKWYLPWSRNGLTPMQKMGETFHSLSVFLSQLLNLFLIVPLMIVFLWLEIKENKIFVLPPIILLLIPIIIVRNMICRWIEIKLQGGHWTDSFLESLATRSLLYTRCYAFLKAWLPGEIKWKRTDKFKTQQNFRRAFSSSQAELITGVLFICIALSIIPFVSFTHPDILFLVWLGILNQAFSFMCAPLMALLSEKELWKNS